MGHFNRLLYFAWSIRRVHGVYSLYCLSAGGQVSCCIGGLGNHGLVGFVGADSVFVNPCPGGTVGTRTMRWLRFKEPQSSSIVAGITVAMSRQG